MLSGRFLLLLLLCGFVPAIPAFSQSHEAAEPDTSLYVVGAYDPLRDPAQDLELAVARAQREGKRILLEVGGDWCSWCHALDRFVHNNEAVTAALREDFLIVKVTMDEENRNEAFLSNYPKVPGYPHLFVLEKDGTLLHSQGTDTLEEGRSYSEAAILAVLERWAPRE